MNNKADTNDITLSGEYLLLLGTHEILSRAELQQYCDEVSFDRKSRILTARNLIVKNPRNLPKSPEQIFLDRLGGVIRVAKVLKTCPNFEMAVAAAVEEIKTLEPRNQKHRLGVSCFGFAREKDAVLSAIKRISKSITHLYKWANDPGKSITSGRYFRERLGMKGMEIMFQKTAKGVVVARTVACQNLRNYTLRDRIKPLRDSHMGMMPPKLAQMMINISGATNETIVDPFCGSGTVNIEAAIMGFNTSGSDLLADHTAMAKRNFHAMSEKFRYDGNREFTTEDATKRRYDSDKAAIVVTEGWLGENFRATPSEDEIRKNAKKVTDMWQKTFETMAKGNVQKICLCLPVWSHKVRGVSIYPQVKAAAGRAGFTPQNIFKAQKTYTYGRDGARVQREMCLFVQQR